MSALPPGTIGRIIRCCCGVIPLSDGWAAVPDIPGGAGPTVPFWFRVPKILPVRGSINSRTACPPLGVLLTTVAGVALIGDDDDGNVDVSVTLQITIRTLQRGASGQRLGWVDLVLSSSTLCLALPGLMGNWQKLERLERWENTQNPTHSPT